MIKYYRDARHNEYLRVDTAVRKSHRYDVPLMRCKVVFFDKGGNADIKIGEFIGPTYLATLDEIDPRALPIRIEFLLRGPLA